MATPAAAIEGILAKVDADSIGIVQAADLLEQAFRDGNLLYEMVIHPRQVGFDPVNRDGEGGNAQEVLLLASDIAFVGWSWSETSHAICCEALPGDKTVEEFNKKLCADSGLAPVEEDSIRFGSLSCGHTNMALRAIAAGVPSECPLLSENKVLSLSKLEARDSQYATAVRQGLRWRVIRAEVRSRWPRALQIIQASVAHGGKGEGGAREVLRICT